MNVNVMTNFIGVVVLVLTVVYLLLAYPTVDFFQIAMALFLSVNNFLTGKNKINY